MTDLRCLPSRWRKRIVRILCQGCWPYPPRHADTWEARRAIPIWLAGATREGVQHPDPETEPRRTRSALRTVRCIGPRSGGGGGPAFHHLVQLLAQAVLGKLP